MKLRFRALATLSGVFFLVLALVWLVAPQLLLSDWGLDLNATAALIGRRGAALYAGFGVMLLAARNAAASPARSAILKGLATTCALLAALGLYELWQGRVGNPILAAVAIEVIFALVFLSAAGGASARRGGLTYIK
jgi:peptidoglycan/LPS O-acetylase OafA/YrhL